jgi:clan AA aspartic protease
MIVGVVNAQREAVIGLTLIGSKGQRIRVDAIIDTGFDGWLVLPPHLIAALGYAWHGSCDSVLADGSETQINVFEGTVLWDRRRQTF